MNTKSKIAQIIVDMHVFQKHPIRVQSMVPIIKEVNESKMIGHALRFKYNDQGEAEYIQKYRLTYVERTYNEHKKEM
jgi:hypothetical protein